MATHGTIASIDPRDETTWRDRIFLTFDIDWAHDDVLLDTIDMVEAANVSATWFVTHDTPVLSRLRSNPKFELGIHPNFNFLLSGDDRAGRDSNEVLQRLMGIVPDARSVRSHSMTQSSVLLQSFAAMGLTHDANHFVPASVGYDLRPWVLWNGLTRVPYFWEDDLFCAYREQQRPEPDIVDALHLGRGIKVFDLHPIHVFLNTDRLERYESTRPIHHNPSLLRSKRYEGKGARDSLQQLLSIMTQKAAETT